MTVLSQEYETAKKYAKWLKVRDIAAGAIERNGDVALVLADSLRVYGKLRDENYYRAKINQAKAEDNVRYWTTLHKEALFELDALKKGDYVLQKVKK